MVCSSCATRRGARWGVCSSTTRLQGRRACRRRATRSASSTAWRRRGWRWAGLRGPPVGLPCQHLLRLIAPRPPCPLRPAALLVWRCCTRGAACPSTTPWLWQGLMMMRRSQGQMCVVQECADGTAKPAPRPPPPLPWLLQARIVQNSAESASSAMVNGMNRLLDRMRRGEIEVGAQTVVITISGGELGGGGGREGRPCGSAGLHVLMGGITRAPLALPPADDVCSAGPHP